jgi:zinc D-Ala-D-Ala carboxypeptidase
VFDKLYALQDHDCTPKHFAFTEFDNSGTCGDQDFGANRSSHGITAKQVKANLRRVMWRLEALRRQLDRRDGDIENTPLLVSSGFREHACQVRVSAAHPSQHEFGRAADLFQGNGYSLCTMAKRARWAGFTGIIGPGSPDGDHEDHVHLDIRKSGFSWTAPSCGV